MNRLEVHVTRGERTESVHGVHAAWTDGGDLRTWGDGRRVAFWRSAMKPFQAIAAVVDGAFDDAGFAPGEVALASASHHGMPRHVEGVRRMLKRLELRESALECGPHRPVHEPSARELDRTGVSPGRIHNNCSGKHAGMLALAGFHGWTLEGYHEYRHPVQARARSELERWLSLDLSDLTWGEDGCGVPTPAITLEAMARAYERLAEAVAAGEEAPARVASAMTEHPDLVSGPGALSCRLMEVTGGRLLAKEGAEGVFCVAGLDASWGLAVKVADGATRAVSPAVITLLEEQALLSEHERDDLSELARPTLRNTREQVVGRIEARRVGSADPAWR